MSIKLYNTLSQKKEVFTPIKENEVSFYVCGVTVYDYCHIGHARAYVAFDGIRRYLEHKGYKVNYIQNFTDIDDKIINRSNEINCDFNELTEKFIAAYFNDMDQLNIKRATQYPKATEHIDEIIKMIKVLIDKNHAYEIEGDIYFAVDTYKDYGKLSKKVLEDLVSGIRVDISDKKKNPLDFALWKKAKENEPSWDSPWGKGRPGWHIECSAMSTTCLADTIDIHGGGADLIFPHHENEICQSECATNKQFAKYWIHNGFVNIKNEKMSKSKKNFLTVNDILNSYNGEVLRFYLQKMHYRQPLNFSFEGLDEAKQALGKLHNTIKNPLNKNEIQQVNEAPFQELKNKFLAAMDDDFNTAEAIGVLFELNKLVNITHSGTFVLEECGKILGLFFELEQQESISQEIEMLIEKRNDAKKNKDYSLADEIRTTLLNEHNIILEDTAQGVNWKKK